MFIKADTFEEFCQRTFQKDPDELDEEVRRIAKDEYYNYKFEVEK